METSLTLESNCQVKDETSWLDPPQRLIDKLMSSRSKEIPKRARRRKRSSKGVRR
jgi:hypothetical protein